MLLVTSATASKGDFSCHCVWSHAVYKTSHTQTHLPDWETEVDTTVKGLVNITQDCKRNCKRARSRSLASLACSFHQREKFLIVRFLSILHCLDIKVCKFLHNVLVDWIRINFRMVPGCMQTGWLINGWVGRRRRAKLMPQIQTIPLATALCFPLDPPVQYCSTPPLESGSHIRSSVQNTSDLRA